MEMETLTQQDIHKHREEARGDVAIFRPRQSETDKKTGRGMGTDRNRERGEREVDSTDRDRMIG